MFQHVFVEFYGHIISNYHISGMAYPTTADEYRQWYLAQWFKYQPVGYQTGVILLLSVFCYVVQYLVQDTLVAFLYAKALQWSLARTKAKAAISSSSVLAGSGPPRGM